MADLPQDLSWLPLFALDQISDLVVITDADLDNPDGPRIIYVNQPVLAMTGYREDEVLGRSPKMFQGAGTDRAAAAKLRSALRAGLPVRETLLNYTKAGEPYWNELNVAPLRDTNGTVIHYLSVQRNVTEQRMVAEAQERVHRFIAAGEKIGKMGTWSYDLDHNKVLWSEGTYDIYRWDKDQSPPDINGCLELIVPSEREIMSDLMDRCVRYQEPFQWEVAGLTASGEPIQLVVRGEALKGEDGRTKAVVGALRDVTDEKRTVEALDETLSKTQMLEKHFASARAVARIGMFNYSVATDLQTWSDELHDITGLPSSLFPASAEVFLDRVDEADRPGLNALMNSAIAENRDFATSVRFHRPDGRLIHMQIIAENRIIGGEQWIVGIIRDITEDVEAANRVIREKERFEIIADTVGDVLWDFEIDKKSWWLTPNWPQKLGMSIDGTDFDPARWTDYMFADDRAKARAALAGALRSHGNRWRSEFRLLDADGSTIDAELNAKILRRPDGRVYRMLGSLRNVTVENRRREGSTRSRALEAVGKMTGGIAHDFNNLLMIIQGNAELLGLTEHTEDDRESIQLITKASAAAADLTARLLSFSGQVRLKSSKVNLRELVSDLTPLLRSGLTSAVELKLNFADDLWDTEVDVGALEQAMINLAVNARDAMPRGGTLEIQCTNHVETIDMIGTRGDLEPGDYVRVRVTDTGGGMSEDVLAKACEPFFTTKDVGKGTGLGLSTVYGFAKQSGGGLQIRSVLGEGTSISIYLPASNAVRDSLLGLADEAGTDAEAGKVRILVVEDEPDIRRHVEKLLRRAGYEVVAAPDAKTALEVLRSDRAFDILFTDVVMPGGINGVQLAEAAARIAPGMKVLYTSGFPASAFDQIGVEAGNSLVLLSKPYKSVDLIRTITDLVRG